MTERDDRDWQDIHKTQDDKGIRLKIEYSKAAHTYSVSVSYGEDSDNSLSERFNATYEPVFGMDVSDQEEAYEIAERLAVQLERKLNL